jgi:cation diffusion facilitator family transporter
MADCCENKSCALDALRDRQTATLKIVLVINVVLFVAEITAAIYSRSSALLSDSLDNFGDALTYGISLYAVARSAEMKAKVALFKSALIFTAGFVVLGQVIYRVFNPAVPLFETMGIMSLVALAANAGCLTLLWKHRIEDVNMSSVWECSRNDIASNLAVFVSAGAVWFFGSGWPDVIVALALAALFLWSATGILRRALQALHVGQSARSGIPITIVKRP